MNPIQTAHFMGHVGGTEMLHRHYKGLVSKTEADKFWALRPSRACVHDLPLDTLGSSLGAGDGEM